MPAQRDRSQSGATLVVILLVIFVLVAVGAFALLATNRNTDMRFAYQKSAAGFNAAEAGLYYGAGGVKNTLLTFGVPSNCGPQTVPGGINTRTVVYQLSGCGSAPVVRSADAPYQGLNAQVYTYSLNSKAVNVAGFTEAILDMQFNANLIPMFQFAAFYKSDLESLPGPAYIINGRVHSSGDLYLNSNDCASGQQILGQITVGGSLNRGRKDTDSNANHVWINDASGTPQILGTDSQGSLSCATTTRRTVSSSETATWGGRITTNVSNISLPGADTLLCTPWSCPGAADNGNYWDRATVRIVLDTTTTRPLSAGGPSLFPVEIVNQDGSIDATRTAALQTFMQTTPGAITYSDVPAANADCRALPTCESTYASATGYQVPFPRGPGVDTCPAARGPRQTITAANYCSDYRTGGFYNWRESKPILMLNVDWMALDEWNLRNGGVLFDPSAADASIQGVVAFLSVKGANAAGANDYAVRLYDTARVRRNTSDLGITFASDTAAYLTGDFNCPAPAIVSDTVPAACGAAGNQKAASVVADSVNMLSCAWVNNSGQACGTVSMNTDQWAGVGAYRLQDERSTQPAANGFGAFPTIVNAAFLAGNDQTWCPGNPSGLDCGNQWYSGGLENYPRMHENWGGQRLWYQGSFVSIGTPKHTCFAAVSQVISGIADDPVYSCRTYPPDQGFWSQQRYSPPLRRWFYDVNFNNVATLPPLTPRFVYVKQNWLKEEFQ